VGEPAVTGYSVRTGEGLRYFRDTTLADAAAAIEDLRRKIDATHIPTGAWPKAAAGRQSDYTTTINAMLDDTGRLTSLNDRHIDGITATAAGYDDAENATLTAVTGHAATHGTGGTTAATARPVAATTGVPATTGSGDVGPGAVLRSRPPHNPRSTRSGSSSGSSSAPSLPRSPSLWPARPGSASPHPTPSWAPPRRRSRWRPPR
jgi:hypothetical protein